MSDLENKDRPYMTTHVYDDIEELDYPLPRWWVFIFIATIVFGFFYCGYYLTGIGPSLRDELKTSLAEIAAKNPAPGSGGISDDRVLAAFHDPKGLQHGGEIYAGKCMPCHGDKGQGVIGPNLTDDYWIHGGGSPGDIATVISNGVADKGMPTWSTVLSPEDIVAVAAYVRSLHGTNPPGAKAPQGELREFKSF